MAENTRDCASCGATNEEDARFCEGCGSSLARICGTCGVEASAAARFCRGCGAALDAKDAAPAAAAGPVRRTVTVMFADLAGSTSFEERVDAETAREVIGRYHELLRTTAQSHRAGVTKYIGDGFMAVWGVPETGADDAGHAVDAAVELQDRFVDLAARVNDAHGVDLALRVAVNTGEVVVGSGDADLVGDALNVGARLEAECPRGHVVVGEETWRSTRGRHRYDALGQVQVKGRTTPVAVFQWLGRHAESADAAGFVGRTDEVRRLQSAFDDATVARAARMVTVIGDPGVGKTRLAAEFVAAQPDSRVIRTRCNVEETVALAPIVELLRSRDLDADVPSAAPERDRMLRALTGLAAGVPGSVEETFWALRRFVEALAVDGPLLIVLDDLQWADALLLDFVEHLVEWVTEVPVLLVAIARPELREVRPDFVAVSRWVTQAVHLGGLDAKATAELAAEVLGGDRLPEELLRRLPSSTGGNPLFVRELIGMLVDDAVLVHEPVGWRLTIDVDAITIPPTIHALLASRLERLDAVDRRVLEVASVLGTDFSPGAVSALAERGVAAIKLALDRLRRLQLAQPSGAYVGDEPVWRFHHVLIRDVAYRRLLKSDRADLHERFADWVEADGATLASDPDEMVARHLESAYGYRLDLGTLDDRAADLALRSARCYLASSRRALERDELVSSGTQAARGAALAVADDPLRAQLLLVGCESFLSAGDVTTCAPLVDDLERVAGEPLAPWAICYRSQFIVYTDPERLLEVDARLQDAIDEFGRRKDAAGLAKARRVRGGARARLGRIGDCETDLLEALIAARQSGDQRQITAALSAAPSAALWGPSPVPKAGGRCLDVVRMQRMATAAPSLEATSLRCLAVLELLRGRPDKARTMLADARQVVADLGLRHGLMETELFAGIIESMVGDPVAAEPHFRAALEGLDALGVGADAGLAAALLARSVLAQGRVDDADGYAAESERLAGHNLKTAVAWRAVRAEIHCAQGSYDAAVALAREAVLVAAGTDLVLDHADACRALSRVLTAAGDAQGADGARRDAEALYAAKEVVGSIGQTVQPAKVPPSSPVPVATPPTTSRLAVTNRACAFLPAYFTALRAHDVDGTMEHVSDRITHDDRRRFGGVLLVGFDAMRHAIQGVVEQYTRFDHRVLAVRGERLLLRETCWSDDDGNETTHLIVNQVDDGGRIDYHGMFDVDDFEGAYRELERRYYAGEGAAFAESGSVVTEWIVALNQSDLDRVFGELCGPDFRFPSRSRSAFGDRSAAELRASLDELSAMVTSARTWLSAFCWVSPTRIICLFEREAVGLDGEQYAWTWLMVCEVRDGQFTSMCDFEPDDEDAAFAYADERLRATTSRLAVTNRASGAWERVAAAIAARDVDAAVGFYSSDRFVYDDRRALSGDPIEGNTAYRAGMQRVLEQYSHFEGRTLAIRGERLALNRSRWSDDAGNETVQHHLYELDDDGHIGYEGRFDEDDFESAYRELERRYYAGEGAAFAANGRVATGWVEAMNQLDVDSARRLSVPDFRWLATPSALTLQDGSVDDVFRWLDERGHQLSSVRNWLSAVKWLSPTCTVVRSETRAIGPEAEEYAWSSVRVCDLRDGLLATVWTFDDDEDAAFAYAEDRVRATDKSRLAVTNRSSATWDRAVMALTVHDVDAAVEPFSDRYVLDDRRGLSGDPVAGRTALRAALERILLQYNHFDGRSLAVRGGLLHLAWTRWWDDAGNEGAYLHVYELGLDGLIGYEARFDEDDFEGAYRELERRYYTGEGAAFAEAGAVPTEWMIGLNQGDFDRVFGELAGPDFRLESRSRSVFGDRSAAELRTSFEELTAMVASSRWWVSAICWLSPICSVSNFEREAVGLDGERYTWTRLTVNEVRGGRVTAMCDFDPDDEEAAFAYAEERVQAKASRLALTNRASQTYNNARAAMKAHDTHTTVGFYADPFTYDDRRRLSGDPVDNHAQLQAAAERILTQYTRFEGRTLAVRGEKLQLYWSCWADDAGNETSHLHVLEVDDEGRLAYEGRFDEDDFEGAYRELEQRYYAGEGAAFAAGGAVSTEFVLAMNRGDPDSAFGELTAPDFLRENRSRSVFGDRSAAEVRASFDELTAMVASARGWLSAICWLSSTCGVSFFEREAVGVDEEQYSWTRLIVTEVRDGRVNSMCDFDPDAEDEAFAYAEALVAARPSRLAVTNRASETWDRVGNALAAHDLEAVFGDYSSDRFTYDDRRGFSGDPIEDRAALRAAGQRIFEQFSHFDGRLLAVRGERLALGRTRWSDDFGNETVQLHVYELGDDGLIGYEGRFDGDDFEGAYRELDRRYYAGEGAVFAAGGAVQADYAIATNRGDFDRLGEITAPDFRATSQSRSVFGDRSAAEYRASLEELAAMVASARMWFSAVCWLSASWVVSRFEREAVGLDGEQYAWTRLTVTEVRDGRVASLCEFELEDEDEAFAYAEELNAARPSRLAVANLATESELRMSELWGQPGYESAMWASTHEQFQVVDRRAMPAAPCIGREAALLGFRRLRTDYPDIEVVPLAVRGQLLSLVEWRCRTPSGFEATYLNVHEFDDIGQLLEQVRFDGDDFEGAYRELERRYYAGEGAAFAAGGALQADYVIAINRGNLDRVFDELVAPDFHLTNRSRSVFGDRSAAEHRASLEELAAMVASARSWVSAVRWLSAACCVIRMEREAVGPDGEQFSWTKLHACAVRDGRVASMCQFELENEDEAFAYAEDLIAARPSRLAVTNLATDREQRVHELMGRPEFDSALSAFMHDEFRVVDHRAMSGAPFIGREAGLVNFRRFLVDYPDLNIVPLAVRGERLALVEYRGRSPGGYETTYLNVNDFDESGQLMEQVRFDGDDFEGAYRELEQRYYAGEGAAFAAGGALWTDYVVGVNRGDLDKVFADVVAPDFRLTSRSRSVFGDRSADQYRAGIEELAAMVASARAWVSAVRWLSPTICVFRTEREAVGLDGEAYAWTRLFTSEVRGGLIASAGEFELEDEDAAFAYAEELVRSASERI